MDVEGGEILILKGAKSFLEKHKPTMFISLHPAWLPDFKNDIRFIIDTFMPIYDFIPASNLYTTLSESEVMDMVGTAHEHSFVLKAK